MRDARTGPGDCGCRRWTVPAGPGPCTLLQAVREDHVFGRGCVQRPQRMDIVDAGEDAAVADREHRRNIDRGDPAEQGLPRGRHVVLGPRGGLLHPRRAELRPHELPEGPQRVRRRDQRRLSNVSSVVLEEESHGVHRERRPQRHDRLQLVAAGFSFDLRREVSEQIVVGHGIGQDRWSIVQANPGPGTREPVFPG